MFKIIILELGKVGKIIINARTSQDSASYTLVHEDPLISFEYSLVNLHSFARLTFASAKICRD